MKNSQLAIRAILNSVGVTVYIFLVSLIMNNGDKLFGASDNNAVAPIAFLLLFIFSALVTGGLILAKPIMLYLDGQKRESLKLLFYTGASLFVLLLIFLTVLFLIK
jgi:hypothetical protein